MSNPAAETTTAANPFHRSFYLTGPTASGKTAVGVALARRMNAEVVALDSMTLYRGMDIGTAKPTAEERAGIPHHLIDIVDPWDTASVADYRHRALTVIAEIEARGHKVLFVGGTALYLKALLRGLFDAPTADPSIRRDLEAEAERLGDAALHARLATLDPTSALRLHPNDRRRVVRALEVLASTGRTLSEQQVEHAHHAPPGLPVFAIERPREELVRRIDRRVEQMFDNGLVEEVRKLQSGSRPIGIGPSQGVGYKEVIDHLDGRVDLAGAVALTQARTRQFAKRQATWFRGLAEVRPWPIEPGESADATADRMFAWYGEKGVRPGD